MATLGLDMEQGLFLGIDFGTTNSVVSIFDFSKGEAVTIPIDGSNIFPTAIQFEKDTAEEGKLSRIFGIEAKEAAIIYPESTVLSVKQLLGSDEDVKILVDEEEFSFAPEQVAGEILGHLKRKADAYAQEELQMAGEFLGCVITVPANSTDKQKAKTKEAAILAGFEAENVYLRLEPAAAAISYAIDETADKTVLVYDFGGGTFDACILEIKSDEENEPNISILSTFGDNKLGGNDIDKIVMDMIYDEFLSLTDGEIDLFNSQVDDGVSARQKQIALVRLQQVATQVKERLSGTSKAKVTLAPFIQEPKIINITMDVDKETFLTHKRKHQLNDSKETFEKFENKSVLDLIELTMEAVNKSLETAGLTPDEIDEVFLVGGSSSIEAVPETIEKTFNKEPYRSKISPALSISQGAAYYCNMIMMPTVKGPTVHEKTIHPLGLELSGRRFMEIVPAGMDIPKDGLHIEAKELLTTNFDNVSSMAIVVYESTEPLKEGEIGHVMDEGMKRLAGTSLRGIPKSAKGKEQVKVVFSVGQDNMLTVTAEALGEDGATTKLSVDDLY